jgi:uncharacterized protein (DUF885 family)
MRRALLALLLLASCATTTPVTPNNDATLDAFLHTYVLGFFQYNPTVNTYLGGAGLDPSLREADGRLRDYSPTSLRSEEVWLTQVRQSLQSIDPATLSPAKRIDREFAIAQIDFMLRMQLDRKYQQRSVDTYTDEVFRSVDFQMQGFTPTGDATYGTPEEWDLLISRVNAIPWYLKNAEGQLRDGVAAKNTADFRMLYRNGILASTSNADYFDKTLPQIAAERMSGPRRAAQLEELRNASTLAAKASRGFSAFVATTFFDDPSKESGIKPEFGGDRFPMGEVEYDWAIRNNLHLNETAAQLYDASWPVVLSTRKEILALAREIGASHGWSLPADDNQAVRAVFDKLGDDHPKTDAAMIDWYREAGFRLVDYARKSGLFDVPADYKLDVVETPAPLLASTDGAAYYPAPPFKTTGVGRFYVSPTGNVEALLRENNRSAVSDLAAHEGFPGHDWYYKVLTTAQPRISPVRWLTAGSIEDSSSMWADSMSSEGWALYSEALLAEPQPGYPSGFYKPEERIYQLQGKLYRDLRVRIDTGIHTGRISFDEATNLYSTIVDFQPGSCGDTTLTAGKKASCGAAERAIFRYSKWPTQAITYRLGKEAIFGIRRDAAAKLGPAFDVKRFHLALIRQGTIPPGYYADAVLQELGAR